MDTLADVRDTVRQRFGESGTVRLTDARLDRAINAGIDELADQIESYHFIFVETPKGRSKDVYRDNEDHVAGVEYANEEWEEGTATGAISSVYERRTTPVRTEYKVMS